MKKFNDTSYAGFAKRLRKLSESMIELGVEMDYYSGLNQIVGPYGRGLVLDGLIASSMADEINSLKLCRKCGGEMHLGQAIQQTFRGIRDFPGFREVVTMSPGGPGRLITVMKCGTCGHSTT